MCVLIGTTNKTPRGRDRRKPVSAPRKHSPSPTPVLKLPFPPLRLPTTSPVPTIPTEPVVDQASSSQIEKSRKERREKFLRELNAPFLGAMHRRARSLQVPRSPHGSPVHSPSASVELKCAATSPVPLAMRDRGRAYSYDSGVAYFLENSGESVESPRSMLKNMMTQKDKADADTESPKRTIHQPPSSLVRRTTPPRASLRKSHMRRSHTHTSGQRHSVRRRPKQAAFEPGFPPPNDEGRPRFSGQVLCKCGCVSADVFAEEAYCTMLVSSMGVVTYATFLFGR